MREKRFPCVGTGKKSLGSVGSRDWAARPLCWGLVASGTESRFAETPPGPRGVSLLLDGGDPTASQSPQRQAVVAQPLRSFVPASCS